MSNEHNLARPYQLRGCERIWLKTAKQQIFIFLAISMLAIASFADDINPVGSYVSDRGETLTARFDNRANTVLLILPDNKRVKLYSAEAASGTRYTNGNKEFWEHHGQATYSVGNKVLFVGRAQRATQSLPATGAGPEERYYRLQLKHGGQYLDADHCGDRITLNPGSDWENGACQLWRFVPAGGGWSRLQLKHGGQYLDADHCGDRITLNPGSHWENGACQLWRFVPAGGRPSAQPAFGQASGLPHFKKHESYANVRAKMFEAGWKPFHSRDADTCVRGDSRCQGRPEMQFCAGTGMANCKFLWKKGEDIAAICTVGEDALYDSICSYP